MSEFSPDVDAYWKYWQRDDRRMRQTLATGDAFTAVTEIAAKYRVARSFRTRFDVGVGLRRYQPVVEALQYFQPSPTAKPVRAVLDLTKRLQSVYQREVLSASSKFLWFLWGRDIIIYDSQALKSLRATSPWLQPKDYVAYCDAWNQSFARCKDRIAEQCAEQGAPAEEWFHQRVFDWHLWRLGK